MPNAVAAAMIASPDVVRDVEFSYENKYIPCEKNKKDCPSGYRYDKEPSIKTVQTDRNQSARDATIEACMYGKGWRENLLLAAMVMQRRRIGLKRHRSDAPSIGVVAAMPSSATSVSALTGVKGTRGGGKGQPKLPRRRRTDFALASSHATTAAQLGRVPIWLMAHLFQRDVFAATQYRLRFGQRIQAIIKCKGACHRRGETSPLPPLRRQALCLSRCPVAA